MESVCRILEVYLFLICFTISVNAHILNINTPPVIPPHLYRAPPLYTGPNNIVFSKYFPARGSLRPLVTGNSHYVNVAKYGGYPPTPARPPGYLNLPPRTVSRNNPLLVRRLPPENFGSIYPRSITPVVQTSKYVMPSVEVIRIPETPSDDEDDEGKGLEQDIAVGIVSEDTMIGGAQISHPINIKQRLLRTPPPFHLYPSLKGIKIEMIPSDIIFVIYTSQNLGHTHPTGKAMWHSGLVNFINDFVHTSFMGPDKTRIGAVVIGHFGVEGLIPMLAKPVHLLQSLTHLQSSFRGQWSDKGLLVAKSLFYQYGRPFAAKKIVLITDATPGCSFVTMPGTVFVRECGIDIIHVKFGAILKGFINKVPRDIPGFWMVPINGEVERFIPPIADRILRRPLDGGWSPWSLWNKCSTYGTCKVGYQMRFRICDNPSPSFGGRPCPGPQTETRFCRMKHCTVHVSGYWTPWSLFSPCSSNCGPGTRTRTRMCLTFDGRPSFTCTGSYVDTADCVVSNCPVQGGWSMWSGWGLCSTACGSGIQIRTRICDQPYPSYDGAWCQGPSVEERVCVSPTPCPLEGGFGPWKKFGRCDVQCGRGHQQFVRECNNPLPQFGGRACIGNFVMKRPCDTGINCPIAGGWSQWASFTPCSVTCGRGVITRKRMCNSPLPMYNGLQCSGPSLEEQVCETGISCAIDGQWSEWTVNSRCSANCGTGIIQRVRYCNNPAPLYGGLPCFGSPSDTFPCNTGIPCPIDGGWSPWSQFSTCPVNCGTGFSTRHRRCNNPIPDGGPFCIGLDRDFRQCDTDKTCLKTGMWSPWLTWSYCSANCGVGVRQRTRICSSPFQTGGSDSSCAGNTVQEEKCDTGITCPVNGAWSAWSETLPCSVTCGAGYAKRVRHCDSPEAAFGGADCIGPKEKIVTCDSAKECPIDGGWSMWIEWGPCVGTCGLGIQQRTRVCNNPTKTHHGIDCTGKTIEERQCDTGILCPIDGFWSAWSAWSTCSADCGTGIMTRHRTCDSPEPKYGGLPCNGLEKEETACTVEVLCPVDGGWSSWSIFTSCSVTCGAGIITRTRSCDNPLPLHNGRLCSGNVQEEAVCETRVECPVHGGWSPWGEFSHCSVTCGLGFQERKRECNSPYPLYDGDACVGNEVERISCKGLPPCPIHGQWNAWTEFGSCDTECGSGIRRRKRLCNNPAPMLGGNSCPGFPVDEIVCEAPINCPVDGNWSPWSGFSICSVTCGVGIQVRKRVCNNPPPLFNGANCFGVPLEERECFGIPCPVNGGWTSWSQFGPCSVSCGKGLKRRVRECANPLPQYGGTACEGPSLEDAQCVTDTNCPVNGGWSLWSDWTMCSSTCGSGMSERMRSCSNPPALFGGQPCAGIEREETLCETGISCPTDGNWSPWSEFTRCSTTCGSGTTQRQRFCNSPTSQYNGKPCPGEGIETMVCNYDNFCPVDGGFSFWSDWSTCSVSCGEGMRSRTRLCNSPEPLYGGKECFGNYVEEQSCLADVYCPIHGQWGPWSQYTLCSETCGVGTRERLRTCDKPVPMYGGMVCEGSNIEIELCDTQTPCPVHGNWDVWMHWTGCSVTCDIGVQKRRRICSNPEPLYGGYLCVGEEHQEQLCNTGEPCPVNGNWGFWMEWQPCDAKCGKGVHIRVRQCDSPSAQYGGIPCVGDNTDQAVCDSGIPCPLDGSWSFWSEWSSCSVSCGNGVRERFRLCTDPEPAYGGLSCDGADKEVLLCSTDINCPIDGSWTPWGPWSACSASCGAGTQIRERDCAEPHPAFSGLPCEGIGLEIRECINDCPIPGNWSPWTEFSVCSTSCGIGTQTRTRSCSNPSPAFGGPECAGSSVETSECQIVLCPVDGQWSPWNSWSRCQGTCGLGIKVRLRECNNPPPANGGKNCLGSDHESIDCSTDILCPVDGNWSPWSSWDKCSKSCGTGLRSRTRVCDNPAPSDDGRKCLGLKNEFMECDTGIPCPVDGQWAPWSSWDTCSSSCGLGLRSRTRVCDNPAPSFNGKQCFGLPNEFMECDTNIPCPINGGWGHWSGWSECNADCGIGIHVKIRYCDSPRPQHGGNACVGPEKKIGLCDTGIKCSIHGNWAPWGEWGSCEGPCGLGQQIRVRTCTNPRPEFDGQLCQGIPEEERQCVTKVPCKVENDWSPWSEWSVCSSECGTGTQTRRRQCDTATSAKYEVFCSGVGMEERECTSSIGCPVDGGWSSWEKWSMCSVTCGAGIKFRYRRCGSPAPRNGGLPCEGIDKESRGCDTRTPCQRPGGWSIWELWTGCSTSCGAGVQYRKRRCDSPVPIGQGMECKGWAEDSRVCNTANACPIHGAWSGWTSFGPCTADCSKEGNVRGKKTRRRFCESPPPRNGGNPCVGIAIDTRECFDFPPCKMSVWEPWAQWSVCSQECGPGFTERRRQCVDKHTGLPSFGCVGNGLEQTDCFLKTCPTMEVNCSTECKWDNGIGYATYPGDCSMFIQCDSLYGEPRVHHCPWGLLWSLEILQCVFPEQSECDICAGIPDGGILPYFLTCRSYWVCSLGVPVPECCPKGHRFDPIAKQCTPDLLDLCIASCPPVVKDVPVAQETACPLRESSLGSAWYEQTIAGVWTPRPCGAGTVFSLTSCGCIGAVKGTVDQRTKKCLPSLHLNFDTLQQDLERNIGIHLENVTYRGDGTAHFDGSAAINSNIFSNAEWGKDVFVYIRFKPEGKGDNQGLVHNSGCGPSDIGPSVFIGIDRSAKLGPNKMMMKFAAVPRLPGLKYEFVNITAPDNKLVDAWFKFGNGQFRAEVDGLVAELQVPGTPVARRHGAINIGGNLCRIGNEAFGGFHGVLDEVRIYKCKPPR